MTPCRDPNDGGALCGLGKSANWSRDRRAGMGARERRNNVREMKRWERNAGLKKKQKKKKKHSDCKKEHTIERDTLAQSDTNSKLHVYSRRLKRERDEGGIS